LSALAWTAPGWVGNGQFLSTDGINYTIAWLKCAAAHGVTIDSIGGLNEKSAFKTPDWFLSLRAALDAAGFGSTPIIASDDGAPAAWNVLNASASPADFLNSVGIVGVHYPCGYLSATKSCNSVPNSAVNSSKPVWATEFGSVDSNTGAPSVIRSILRGYIDGHLTAEIYWPIVGAAYPNLPFPGDGLLNTTEPWSGAYTVGKSLWAIGQVTQFSATGWHFLDGAGVDQFLCTLGGSQKWSWH
jgi:hypothetical protein